MNDLEAKTLTEKIPTRLQKLLDSGHPDSLKGAILFVANVTLIAVLTVICLVCARGIWIHNDLGQGACWAFGLSLGTLALVAGFNIVKDPIPDKVKE